MLLVLRGIVLSVGFRVLCVCRDCSKLDRSPVGSRECERVVHRHARGRQSQLDFAQCHPGQFHTDLSIALTDVGLGMPSEK